MEMHLVTKYNKETSELIVIGIASTKKKANDIIVEDVNILRIVGQEYVLRYRPNGKVLLTGPKINFEYTVTHVMSDQRMAIYEF